MKFICSFLLLTFLISNVASDQFHRYSHHLAGSEVENHHSGLCELKTADCDYSSFLQAVTEKQSVISRFAPLTLIDHGVKIAILVKKSETVSQTSTQGFSSRGPPPLS